MSIYTYVYQPMADLHYIYDSRVLLFTDTRLLYNYNYYSLPSLRTTQYIGTYYMVHTLSSHLYPAISILFSYTSIHLLI